MKPLIASTVFGILMMFVSVLLKDKKNTTNIAIFLFIALLGINVWSTLDIVHAGTVQSLFNEMLVYDSFSVWFTTLMTALTLLYILLCRKHIERVGQHVAEYYALLFFITSGINLLSSFGNLLVLFIGIEIISIPQYILVGSDKRNLKSTEASLKYFLMGSFSTGILLMGIALLYGAMGTFTISQFHFDTANVNILSLAGVLFLMVALGFKVSAAPMHFWTPDVYDGAPTAFTAYIATIAKVVAFAAFIHLFTTAFGAINEHWQFILAIITALTLLIGNVTAVFQQSVKRMLAYSSITQAGFMLFAVISNNAMGMMSIIVYSVAYCIATIGIFTVLMKLKDYTYDGFNGLAKKEPWLALFATICMLSLAGIPLSAGFFGKWYVLTSVLNYNDHFFWLVIFALIMAAISSYYYFKVIIAIYFKQGDAELIEPTTTSDKLFLGITSALVILFGIMPELLYCILQKP